MGRAFGFVSLIIVVAVGAYIYMRQTQSVVAPGASSPTSTVDLMGVKSDLLAIAQAERSHAALQGSYASLETLRSQGDLAMDRNNRGPYTYSAEVSDSGFRIVATYSGPESAGMPGRSASTRACRSASNKLTRLCARVAAGLRFSNRQ